MLTSLAHIPIEKRIELENMVNFIKDEKETFIEMIVLFGSYARGTAVEDKYIEDGTTYEYKSDFDLLFILSDEKKARKVPIINSIRRRIKKGVDIKTPLSIIFHGVEYVNQELQERNYFFVDIYNEGVLLYNRGIHDLDSPPSEEQLPKDIRLMKARFYYEKWLNSADSFLLGYETYYNWKNNPLAVFHLHQTAEHLYMAILLVYTDYKPKSHNLLRLNGRIVELDSRFGEAFPCRTKDEIEMLKRLSDAYIESRYKKNYTISRSELDYLESCVRKLQRLAEEVCKEYIKDFSTQVNEIPEDLQEKIAQMDNGIMQFYEARQNAMTENKKVLDEVRNEGKIEGVAEGLAKGKTEGKLEGIAEGFAKGKREEKKEIARKMLAKGLDLDTISEMTDLPLEELEKLNK